LTIKVAKLIPCKTNRKIITLCCIDYTLPWVGFRLTTLVVIGTDCTGSVLINCTCILKKSVLIIKKLQSLYLKEPDLWMNFEKKKFPYLPTHGWNGGSGAGNEHLFKGGLMENLSNMKNTNFKYIYICLYFYAESLNFKPNKITFILSMKSLKIPKG
jgi:hypothetical protein